MSRQPVIVGVADHPLNRGRLEPGGTPLSAQARVAHAALAEAGLSLGDVDGLFTAGAWGIPGPGQCPTMTLSEYLGIAPRVSDSSNIGGASFESHVASAYRAIEQGDCDVALITYGSTQKSDRSRSLAGRAPILTMQFEGVWGMPMPVGGYALAATRHMHQYGTTREHLAEIAVATRKWAALNPQATRREPLSIEDVLDSPAISDPLHLLDCCLVTDGAGAVVLTTEDHARAQGVSPIYVRGYGESQTHWTIASMPDLTTPPSAASGRRALEMAGVSPSDIDVAELYDSFTITVLLTLEAIGFCGPGEGGAFVSNQRTAPGGQFALNTNGGGLSYAHPGMYGIFLLTEAVRQLRGECGDRQVNGARTALVNGTGGTLSSASTCVLSNY
ncbi:acetyl-CoA acetyltransferase [Rhodococcoides yunnanense]|uniref:acetyl-CoA acetyltransferase n=1 Tax=Rhodococcoides yunnanense TaxID=278209 RepID=UPI000933B12F|nr:acetyl-CoA acetyltransferase [Rhodococcus yunnanensis]